MVYYQWENGSKNYLTKKASQSYGNLAIKKKKTDFKRKNMKITYSANMTLKSSYELLIKSYEQFQLF